MARKARHAPLRVFLNNRLVGYLFKEPGGAVHFRYEESWLAWDLAFPVSLSLPLREDAYKGETVIAVFDNLLPDSDRLRARVAEKVGASGTDAYSLLSCIGRDCVGALQFIAGDDEVNHDASRIEGEPVDEQQIDHLLNHLAQAPLGLDRDQEFRICIAGAQEKTALLFHKGQWQKPHGTTPTTHILKTQIGRLPNGLDLSNSVENEFYCLKLMAASGLPVNQAGIKVFGKTKALVIERFDRRWTAEGRLLRLPQEDCCQALSVPPGRKYQSEGGPGMVDILKLLGGSDTPAADQRTFLKAQMLFWFMGATDGHAKNFSVFLGPRGRFHMTPLYDILTAQPSLEARQIRRQQMKLAMSVGDNRHYTLDSIQERHFAQTAARAGLPGALASEVLDEIVQSVADVMKAMEAHLPPDFPAPIHESLQKAFNARLRKI